MDRAFKSEGGDTRRSVLDAWTVNRFI